LDTTKLGGANGLSFVLPLAMVVTKDNLQDAVTICADKPESYLLDSILTEQEVLDTYFVK
jgi:ribose transport system substrate-binding protein